MPFKGCLSDACVLMKIERFVLKPLRKIERFVLKQRTFRFADYSYCFDDATVGNLFNAEGLPVAPFRTDR